VDVGKQVVTGVHHNARCREIVYNRHTLRIVQRLHYFKSPSTHLNRQTHVGKSPRFVAGSNALRLIILLYHETSR
jgi:hypothetical protein